MTVKVRGIQTGADLLARLQQLTPEQLSLPVRLHTGWEGPEHLVVGAANVVTGEYKTGTSVFPTGTNYGKHILLSA